MNATKLVGTITWLGPLEDDEASGDISRCILKVGQLSFTILYEARTYNAVLRQHDNAFVGKWNVKGHYVDTGTTSWTVRQDGKKFILSGAWTEDNVNYKIIGELEPVENFDDEP